METGNIFSLLGGVALFLFGMSVMGDSLKKVAGPKMEMILYKLSGNPIKAIVLGAVVTAVIQSSSATSVMVVGFVNSGMMKVRQAICIILGAILGTSITGWILALNSLDTGSSGILAFLSTEVLSGAVALIGIGLWMFAKKNASKNIGGIMLGFAVLMYGMSMMSGAIAPLRTNEKFIELLMSFSNPILGVIAGLVLTAVIQSASAAVGILQALAMTGGIEFDMAFPILMGIGIGASVPVMLSALGASVNGKRTAFVYLIIDVLGAVIVGVIFYAVNAVIHFPFMTMTMTMFSIALTNTLYRLAVVIVLAPLVGVLEKIVCLMFPESDDALAEKADMDLLEERFLEHPALSISQSKMVIDSMATKALEAVLGAIKVRREYDPNGIKKVRDLEDVLDRYEDKIGSYLFKITTSDLNEKQSQEIAEYLNVITDFERIGDHTRNVTEAVEEIEEKRINLSGDALKEMSILEDAITEVITLTIDAFVSNDADTALKIEPLEEVIDVICDQIKSNHIDRVSRQECTLENGFAFDDLLTDYERISDHCSNIAINVMKVKNISLDPREYYKSIDNIKQIAFENYLQEYREKYSI